MILTTLPTLLAALAVPPPGAQADSSPGLGESIAAFLGEAAKVAWGLPFILMLGSVGLFYTLKLKLPQLRNFGHAVGISAGRYDEKDDPGEVTHFQALCAALSATVGVGNIAGVATAIALGGPGAAVWMMLFGALGMMTKFASCTLAIRYRVYDEDGHILGGPMESIQRGLGPRFKWLATAFAICALIASFGGGNMVQANQMANAFTHEFKDSLPGSLSEPVVFLGITTNWLRLMLGAAVAAIVASVIIGGMKRIGQVAGVLVPVMAVFYVGGAMTVILLHLDRVPETLGEMFTLAFAGGEEHTVVGGVVGYSVVQALTWGARRAVFSNEAGLGSAPIAHAAAKTKEPIREGLVAMMEPFIDTVVICMMTALVILMTDAHVLFADKAKEGAIVTREAFRMGLEAAPWLGAITVSIGLILFAISTAISWSYYGDRCASFLFGAWAVKPYRLVYVIVLFFGANLKAGFVWDFSDVANAAMAFWHIVALLALVPVVLALYRDYFSREQVPTKGPGARLHRDEGGTE
ncbi:MAG: alanine/glycine:cation symporter family protein [Planctomycetota bacterium]